MAPAFFHMRRPSSPFDRPGSVLRANALADFLLSRNSTRAAFFSFSVLSPAAEVLSPLPSRSRFGSSLFPPPYGQIFRSLKHVEASKDPITSAAFP